MPSLTEIKQKRYKKFIKKPYRSWNLNGEININTPFTKCDTYSVYLSDNNQTTERQQSDNRETTVRQQRDNRETTDQTTDQTTVRQQRSNN